MTDTNELINQIRIVTIDKLATTIGILLLENKVPSPLHRELSEKIMREVLASGVVDEFYQRTWEEMKA